MSKAIEGEIALTLKDFTFFCSYVFKIADAELMYVRRVGYMSCFICLQFYFTRGNHTLFPYSTPLMSLHNEGQSGDSVKHKLMAV